MTRNRLFLLGSCLWLLCACGSSSEAEDDSHAPDDEPEAGRDAEPPAEVKGGLADDALEEPEQGFQVRSQGTEIAAGEDIEYCEIGELPGDPEDTYYVKSIELANADFSHHLVLLAAEPGSAADETLRQFEVGDKVVCNGATFEWPDEGFLGLATAQAPYIRLGFPDGVGLELHGGQRIVFDYHYVNPSSSAVRAESAANIHTVDGATIEHIATAFSFFNFTLDVPAGGAKAFTAECHFDSELMISGLVRHTHEHGTDFSVWWSGGERDGDHIWTSDDWKHEIGFDFEEPLLVQAGEGFRFECAYENATNRRIRYGIRGTDEMCILAGWIWSAGEDKELPSQNCAISWIDDEDIGHPADEAGGFPEATAEDARLCEIGLSLTGAGAGQSPECVECSCTRCGSILVRCGGDPDCAALAQCLGGDCGTQAECVQACEQELHDHSSANGLMQQVNECLAHHCPDCAPGAE